MTIACQKRKRKSGNVYRYVVTVRKKYFSATESLTFPDKAKAVEQEMLEQSVNAEQDTLRYESAKSRSGDITLNQYLEAYYRKMVSLRKESQISYRDMQAIKFWQRSQDLGQSAPVHAPDPSTPPDFWEGCMQIEKEYWASNGCQNSLWRKPR